MSLAQWTEPKPCALSRPRFIKIRLRDERGVPTGDTYTKRIGRATCASGEAAVTSVTVNGQVHHLCLSCTKDDLLDVLGESPVVESQADFAAPAYMREGDKILVRLTPDTLTLRRALRDSGYEPQARDRTVKRAGCATVRVSVWRRP